MKLSPKVSSPLLGGAVGVVLALAVAGRAESSAHAPSIAPAARASHVAAAARVRPNPNPLLAQETEDPIAVDGELDEATWTRAARTGAFLDDAGEAARPFSEARVTFREGTLYLGLYAADERIDTTGPLRDAFQVKVGGTSFMVSADGHVEGAPPGTRAAVDVDGLPNDDAIDDEEWKVELAIPMARLDLAGGAIALELARCDTPRDGVKRCGSWRGNVTLASGRSGE